MGRQPCCEKTGLKRGPWTIEEDHKLVNHILNNGFHCWRIVPKLAGLSRCGKSCRLRWINYLRPDLKRGPLSEMEENQIILLHSRLGNKWSKIAAHFPGRTDNEIKNHWNTRIKKRLKLLGINPLTPNPIYGKEKPKTDQTLLEDEKTYEVQLINSKHETSNISSNSEMLCGYFDDKFMFNQGSNIGSTSTCSSSLSSEEKFNGILGETHSNDQDNYLQQWVDSFDSCLSWDGFNNLDQDLHFFGTSSMNMP